ncbi:MAG: AAA family ATPase, partial [Spirochaetota bacterium]
TIIIMTSNLGSELILKADDIDAIAGDIRELIHATFKPEFINRLDEIITFHRLDRDQILRIVDIELGRVQKRLDERKLTLEVPQKVKEALADAGFDPAFGARPLKRAIQSRLENPLARELLSGTFADGDTIKVDVKGEELTFTPGERAAAAS